MSLITFSDDMDGLRKIPENIPNEEILKKNLGKPLTSIPDPFKKFSSFGEHNNEKLKEFLNKFNFKFNFKSSTENYQKGIFNNSLMRVLEKYEEIMNIILPTLRDERRKTYSPFFLFVRKHKKFLRYHWLKWIRKLEKLFLKIMMKNLRQIF